MDILQMSLLQVWVLKLSVAMPSMRLEVIGLIANAQKWLLDMWVNEQGCSNQTKFP